MVTRSDLVDKSRTPNLPSGAVHFDSSGVRPDGLLIACTDPVLDSCLLPRLKSKRLAVWRCAGPVVPPYGAGSDETERAIDDAVSRLGVREIAICGHLPGNNLWSLVENHEQADNSKADPRLRMARATQRIVHEKYGALSPDELQQALVEENVFVQLANLRTYPAVLSGLARGILSLRGWIYDADKNELYVHGSGESRLASNVRAKANALKRPLPCLDPSTLYLA